MIIEDPIGDMRRHAEQLNRRLNESDRMLRAVLLAACQAAGGPIRVSPALLDSADIGVRMETCCDPATGDILFFAHRG